MTTVNKRAGGEAPAALVAAAYGVGDILRVTPLVRALSRLGYAVDVLVAPDYAETVSLLAGAPEIRSLVHYENFRANRGARPVAGLDARGYELAAFTLWSAPLKRWVRARRIYEFRQREWLREGDSAAGERIARAAGWEGEMPAPFAVASGRRFDLPPGTVALHPGCKPDWPWKKWHGFDELARMFPSVVVVGTEADLKNEATYFGRAFEWPAHAQSFVGRLNLRDTAALLSECAALVSNDSGLMHLGVAVGTPTFGVFGITSPGREAIRSPQMIAVSKGLACEAACRAGKWGRRDCDRHLECLKTLTAEEVFARVRGRVPEAARETPAAREKDAPAPPAVEAVGVASVVEAAGNASSDAAASREGSGHEPVVGGETQAFGGDGMEELSVAYYGYVFDASGYGHAARAYIHALHAAGVRLSVVPLANRAPQVGDALVESLTGRDPAAADFHLFHGIPPQWAARAFPLRNAIGMTVWETDAMPSQWRNALNHVLEVWLPCEHNVSVFRRALDRPVFKLPHPLLPQHFNGDAVRDPAAFLRVAPADFVFYSLFEWQQRKSPHELIETYLREFSGDADAVLLVKANPGAAGVAARALEEARARTKSRARVELRCEAWADAEIDALHARGDCYVSLHRGEGWGYPLFEAAARGTPVVATGYSGPLEYLNQNEHGLVGYRLAQVRQPYVYYSPRMRWAEPDFAHAAALMRGVYERRDEATRRAAAAAARLRGEFSLEAVGRAARARLTEPQRWQRIERAARPARPAPGAPIPAGWYDADYFEHGLKSNWERGYSWELFSDLFKRTALYLTETFTEAESFLDAGCAKGFLVRALRERGKDCVGFDHSEWAVAGADESVKPYLVRAGADEIEFEREFDMLLAFSLFESLTEEQIRSFLARARGWTRHALFASIPSFADREEEEFHTRDDRDYSHITMRTRAWWHETFLAAGWRQDAIHRTVERACQAHELPRRMGWKIYVYAPR
ncbi:MAG: glycosyltransferase [Acidobacteria bacterium]|nr:glycosyltransferase [Acidobacteriota bacterium]